ncbi:MAG: hypothetical protein KBA38_06120 [Negativicutes bacterium]|nr:hypothetical protein [Negativicutes bacterium]
MIFLSLIATIFGAPIIRAILIIIIFLILLIVLYQWIWHPNYMKQNLKYYLLSLLIPIICLAGFQSYKWYDNRIPKLSDQVDIIKYQPFKEKSPNPLLANLATPATVNFTADLPQIDCATALYPLAPSFVEAVYPTNIDYYPYQQNGTSPLLVSKTPLANEIKCLKINGIAPTEENIRNGTYPLSSNFYAITLADNSNPNVTKL